MKRVLFRRCIAGIDVLAPAKIHIEKIERALELLENCDKVAYSKILTLKAILIHPGMGYNVNLFLPERILVKRHSCFSRGWSVQWEASGLYHEVVHLLQFDERRPYCGDTVEKEAYDSQRAFLIKLNCADDAAWLEKSFNKQWWIYKTPSGKLSYIFPQDKTDARFMRFYMEGNLYTRAT